MAYFITFLISFLTLIDYNYGLNCYYCFPCDGTNARLVNCTSGKNFCSILKGTDLTGEEKTARRCETSTDAVSGTCYSNSTYEDYTNVQACLCNTDGCNFNYSTLTTSTTTTKTTTTPTTVTTPITTQTSTSRSTTSQTTTATSTSTTTTTTTSKVPSGGMGPTTLLGATLPRGLTFPSTWFQPPSVPVGGVTPTSYPNVWSDRFSTLVNQLTTFWIPNGISTAQVTQQPVNSPAFSIAGITTTATKSGITPQSNLSKASNHLQSQWLTMIVLLLSSVTFKFM